MNQSPSANYTKWLYLFIGVAAVINLTGLFVPIMGPDATLYATISKTMVLRSNYVELFAFGKDWLDKPHFPFWVTALSFNIFGFTTWAYKLPAILFLFGGTYYTYLFAKSLYNKQVALWAVLILLTAQHIILSNNDVRAEPYLTGLIIAAVYHFYKSYNPNNFWHLLAACLFTACAIMTKGMFALISICGAVFGHLIVARQWKLVFSWRWLIAAILTLILILPELYCLYEQFDAHPEKTVFDRKNVSGIKFFFWDSQFGRFFNTGPIKGHGDPTFFIHTTLWAFLPWSLLLCAAIYQFIKQGIKNVQASEWYCICGSLLTFLLFSASKFQLPHYLNIVFPFFAIITAQYLHKIKSAKTILAVRITQMVVIVLMLAAITALQHFYNSLDYGDVIRLFLFILFCGLLFLPQRLTTDPIQKIIFRTLLASFVVTLYLNQVFYTSLSHYQAGSEAAVWINQNNKNNLPVAQIDDHYTTAMEFYSDKPVINLSADEIKNVPTGQFILYAPSDIIAGLNAKGWNIRQLKKFERYWVTRLKSAFLNEATRKSELTSAEVVLVSR